MIKDEKITLKNIEKRLERIEKLLEILIGGDTLTAEEKEKIGEIDKMVKSKDLSKLIKV